jgi:glycosyltransferase involved in cell wall biosynthesis
MKVVYLTWGETPRSYGVYTSQVINQFKENKKLLPNDDFTFLSCVPVIHSGFVREKWAYAREIKLIKNFLGEIKFLWVPIFATQNMVNSSKIEFNLLHNYLGKFVWSKLKELSPDIVHCRSYHAAWAAHLAKVKFNLNYKIIFDGRDLWPEEVAIKNKYSPLSKNYLFLKEVERILIDVSDSSVSVSEPMHQHYKYLGAKNDFCIPLGVDIDQIKFDDKYVKLSNLINFCYLGALSESGWHKPSVLSDLFRHIKKIYPDSKLTIITTSNHSIVKSYFSEFSVDDVILTSAKNSTELNDLLKKQDCGLMSYFIPSNSGEIKLASILLAIKTVEYLAAGLPVICNKHCGAASDLIVKNVLGLSYDPSNFNELNDDSLHKFLSYEFRSRCRRYAEDNFSHQVIAVKYINLYKKLYAKNY